MNIEKQIEFNKVKEMWAECAVTEGARKKIEEASIILSESELTGQLKNTTNSRNMIEKIGTPPLADISEASEFVSMAEKGLCLTPYQLERVEGMLVAIRRLKDYLSRGKLFDNPIGYYDENLVTDEDLRGEISRQIRGGEVDSHASSDLEKIRNEIDKLEDEMQAKASQVMKSHKDCMSDSFCTTKNGRVCVPVKKDCKLKVSGSVIDKSASGNTLFIEPTSVAHLYEELQLLKIEEENEVYRILYTLSAMVADVAESLKSNIAMIEKLDFIFSKGKFSISTDGIEPEINTNRTISLKDAKHPLMDKAIFVPLQFELGKESRGIVITGPNTGGKTVSIKTVMTNLMMAQFGLHVTCSSANICMNSSYLCDIGDGQNISENLSTFSAHIKNVMDVLEAANHDSFVIMDELGSGTDPQEGMGIAIAILEELRNIGCLFLVTTHYPEVKEYATKTLDVINARMTFDRDTLAPTYHIVIGEAGESCAFYIADRLGMPARMLNTAVKAAYGEDSLSDYNFTNEDKNYGRKTQSTISKIKKVHTTKEVMTKFNRGDSVMVLPDKKIGIICQPADETGNVRVQLQDQKIWINHKRVKLLVAAKELYPEDYDFSIVFDTVEERKARHLQSRKLTDVILTTEE